MSGLRIDSIVLFNQVTVDGDSASVDLGNCTGATFLVKGDTVGDDVTVQLITVDPNGNEFILNTDTLTTTKPAVQPVLMSGKYANLICRLTGISAGTYSAFLNVQREV